MVWLERMPHPLEQTDDVPADRREHGLRSAGCEAEEPVAASNGTLSLAPRHVARHARTRPPAPAAAHSLPSAVAARLDNGDSVTSAKAERQ